MQVELSRLLALLFACSFYMCKPIRYTTESRVQNVVDTIIFIGQNQPLRIFKKEINSTSKSNLPSINIRLEFENLSDSVMILCNSGMDIGKLDSIMYLSYVMDLEYQCEFLLLWPKTKINLEESLMLKGASKYLISYEIISNFSMHTYRDYFDLTNRYKVGSNSYISIGIREYPPEIQTLEISKHKVRAYSTHY